MGVNLVRRGSGVPLIAVHGNGVDHRLLLALDDCFAGDGDWERIYLDLPGFGETAPLDDVGGLPELAQWLVEMIRELVEEGPFALLANSMGGLLARHVVAALPDQVMGLALIAPAVEPDAALRRLPKFEVLECDAGVLDALTPADREEFAGIAVRQDDESWKAFRDHALPGIRAADQAAMDRLSRRYFLEERPEDVFNQFDGPTVIITGRQDHVVGFEDQFTLLMHYPRASYVVIDGAGHNVHLERPAVVEATLRDWAQDLMRQHKGSSTHTV
ncbi:MULTISPECIES: alpha/beta fold hydrolase [unclassified Arthrobacter]|uniref:alpha/beta fold hydrolase n=1 Tax=unclassified Arthrobacter TaxID=235627 RepID=UPI002119CC43|nr:alpha/beta hydrolase [Arthrobacter sp. STN4]MCQ9165850.1 alpha/beta hydrolase [Arthrobacter sp. STN4]